MTGARQETEKNFVSGSVLEAILAALAAIDLSTAQPPPPIPKCRHYKAVGLASDQLKRLAAYRGMLIDEFNARKAEVEQKLIDEIRVKVRGVITFKELTSLLADDRSVQKDPVLSAKHRLIRFIDACIAEEVLAQFPHLEELGNIGIDEDYMVGYVDHSADSLSETLFGGLCDALGDGNFLSFEDFVGRMSGEPPDDDGDQVPGRRRRARPN